MNIENNNLTHFDKNGNIKMVDISKKEDSVRIAKAYGKIYLNEDTINKITNGQIIKGNVLTTAKLAGIMAAKNTYNSIPLCHNILLNSIDINFKLNNDNIEIFSEIKTTGKTGAEMEALHSVCITCLTIYDMCKAIDKNMIITDIKLWEKSKQSV